MPRLSRPRRALLIALAALLGTLWWAPVAVAEPGPPGVVTYVPPVSAPVLDPFRPPATPYGPGNRGIEYDTVPGDPVVSAAGGVVVFAGAVGGSLHVTVRHDDGVRTSYSFVREIETVVGRDVVQGEVIGRTGETFHFGARLGDVYIDPNDLFGAGPAVIVLVPHETPFPGPPPSAALAAWRSVSLAVPLVAATPLLDVYRTMSAWHARRGTCTPATEPVPRAPPGRRVAVLVGGLGSSSTDAAITTIDSSALGYAPGDVVRFSYAGGRVPGTGTDLAGITSRPYIAADTLGDIGAAGARLARLITDVAAAAPGARIEILAHSQGGLVTRVAMGRLAAAAAGDIIDRVGLVVTIATPHRGADLATLVGLVRSVPGGPAALEAVQDAVGLEVEPDSVAVAQLAEGSPLMQELAGQQVPEGLPFLSLAARGDVVVAAARAHLPGATNVVVPVDGVLSDHDVVPASPAVTREIALAAADRNPTCESLFDAVADAVVGTGIGWAESGFGLVPGPGGAA